MKWVSRIASFLWCLLGCKIMAKTFPVWNKLLLTVYFLRLNGPRDIYICHALFSETRSIVDCKTQSCGASISHPHFEAKVYTPLSLLFLTTGFSVGRIFPWIGVNNQTWAFPNLTWSCSFSYNCWTLPRGGSLVLSDMRLGLSRSRFCCVSSSSWAIRISTGRWVLN